MISSSAQLKQGEYQVTYIVYLTSVPKPASNLQVDSELRIIPSIR